MKMYQMIKCKEYVKKVAYSDEPAASNSRWATVITPFTPGKEMESVSGYAVWIINYPILPLCLHWYF